MALFVPLFHPAGIAVDRAGKVYISEAEKHRIRKVDSDGLISIIVGTGLPGNAGGEGGSPTVTQLSFPRQLALDAWGNLYIADTYNHRILKLDTRGFVSSILTRDGTVRMFRRDGQRSTGEDGWRVSSIGK